MLGPAKPEPQDFMDKATKAERDTCVREGRKHDALKMLSPENRKRFDAAMLDFNKVSRQREIDLKDQDTAYQKWGSTGTIGKRPLAV